MHNKNAPAVGYPVGRSMVEGLLVLAVAAVGLLACLWWGLQADAWDWRQLLMLASLSLALALSAARWWRTPTGQLGWDGQSWSWPAADSTAVDRAQLCMDFQFFLLVRLAGEEGRTLAWLWPEQRRAPLQWKALRRALVASPGQRPAGAPGIPPARERA